MRRNTREFKGGMGRKFFHCKIRNHHHPGFAFTVDLLNPKMGKCLTCFSFFGVVIVSVVVFGLLVSDPFGASRLSNEWSGVAKFEVDKEVFPYELKTALVPWGEGQIEVHYVDEGPRDAPVLLMCHGNPTWSFLYHKLIRKLKDRFRCVAADLPGFGLSLEPDVSLSYDYTPLSHGKVLSSLIQVLDLDHITPIIQDWGGPTGLYASLRNSDRIDSFVIGNTWGWPNDEIHTAMFSKSMGNPFTVFLSEYFNVAPLMFFELFGFGSDVPNNEKAMYYAPWTYPGHERWIRGKTSLFPRHITSERDFLSSLEAELTSSESPLRNKPVLYLWGLADVAFGEFEREKFQNEVFVGKEAKEKERERLFENAAHFWQQDVGDEAAEEIQKWFEEVMWM